jgi:hypothetical protein
VPPSFSIRPTVSSAAARLRSTQNTYARRAKGERRALAVAPARPLEPAPTTIANSCPSAPPVMSSCSQSSSVDDASGRVRCSGRARVLSARGPSPPVRCSTLAPFVGERVGVDGAKCLDQSLWQWK